VNARLTRVACALLSVLLAGCTARAAPASDRPAAVAPLSPSTPPASPAAGGLALTKLSYGHDWLIQGHAAPVFVAQDKGYFAEAGLEVTIGRGYGSADAAKRAASGQTDIVLGDTATAMLLRANEGASIKAIAPHYDVAPLAIVAGEEAHVRSPKDLEGKTIADVAGSSPRLLFPAFAALAGFDASKVAWQTVDPAVRDTHLAAGQVSLVGGFLSNVPLIEAMARQQGSDRSFTVLRYADYGFEMYGNSYLAADRLIAERPQVLSAFVAALAKGIRDTYRDPAGAVEILRKSHPELDPETSIRQIEIARDTIITDHTRSQGLAVFDEARMQKTKELAQQYLGLQRDLPLAEFYTAQFQPAPPVLP
jgi:NitT/TauT family transport system substrate-binding protein